MKDILNIRKFIAAKSPDEKIVLCTLVRKKGSSYRAVGAKKAVLLSRGSVGLISGGCLEASIEKAARERFEELPLIQVFDMLADEDRLLGYQTGCQGAIEILFERLPANLDDLDLYVPFGPTPRGACVHVSLAEKDLGRRSWVPVNENDFQDPWIEPVQLVIVGCGADADAYGPAAASLGWSVRYLDYRRDLVEAARFPDGEAIHASIERLHAYIPQGPRVAVVLMTHNYEADLEILRSLSESRHRIGYLGCLGPKKRFERLQTDLLSLHGAILSQELLEVAHAPAGIFTRGRSPEEIALSVIAQIQGELVEVANRWTVILAAGASSRFGGPKALAPMGDGTFLSRALETAREFSGERHLVVTGAHLESLTPHLQSTPTAHNPDWKLGMGSSIARGVAEVLARDPDAEGLVILPVDQPFVSAAHLRALREAAVRSERCALTVSGGVMGPPAYVPKNFFTLAQSVKADHGLKSVLSSAQYICVESPTALTDIDRPQELKSLEATQF